MHIFIEKPNLVKCQKCGYFILPHIVCQNCGYYKGVEVIDVLKKLTKKEKKLKQKEIDQKGAEDKKEKALGWENLSKK